TIDNSGAVQPDASTLLGFPIVAPAASLAAADPITPGATSGARFAPIVIHPVYDSNIANRASSAADPTTSLEIETAVTAAINYIDAQFATAIPAIFNDGTISNGVTINI